MPPLTPELIKLSADLAQKIFAYRITILKAMLPRLMRANYRKILTPITDETKKMPLFQGDPVDLNKLVDVDQIALARKLLRNDQAKIEYLVENKAKKKTENEYSLALDKGEYQKILNSLRQNAIKQRKLLIDIIDNFNKYPKKQSDIESELKLILLYLQMQ